MNKRGLSLFAMFLFGMLLSLYFSGCRLAGNYSSDSPGVPAPTTLLGSSAAKSFIVRSVSEGFSLLKSQNKTLSMRSQLLSRKLPNTLSEKMGVGTTKVSYGPADVVDILGVAYTFTGGSQVFQTFDSSGSPVDDETKADSLVITNQSLAFSFVDEGIPLSAVSNGKLILSGLQSGSEFSVGLEDFSVTGTVNRVDSFAWRRSGSVSINESSYPFPLKGQSEASALIYNGAEYRKLTVYDGAGGASCFVTGAETFGMTMNLASGKMQSFASGMKASPEDRFVRDENGVITDKLTNLQWFRSTEKVFTWRAAFEWTKSLGVAAGGWRMPRPAELPTLYSSSVASDLLPEETWQGGFGGPTALCVGKRNTDGYLKSREEAVTDGVLAVRAPGVTNPMRIQSWKVSNYPHISVTPGWTELIHSGGGRDNTHDDGDIRFFYRMLSNGDFKPLGDVLYCLDRSFYYYIFPPYYIQRVAPTEEAPDALAHPVGFEWQGDNRKAGNFWAGKKPVPPTLHYWRMIPPPGYVALGYCFTDDGAAPDIMGYWCVKQEYVDPIGTKHYFSDSGTGWSYHNLDLSKGELNPGQIAPPGRELGIPNVVKGHCTDGSGHPDAGAPQFYALDLPPGKWPTVHDGRAY